MANRQSLKFFINSVVILNFNSFESSGYLYVAKGLDQNLMFVLCLIYLIYFSEIEQIKREIAIRKRERISINLLMKPEV